jgi:hypothetical protein
MVKNDKDKRIKKELNKLHKIFNNIDEDKKKTVEALIDNAAWLAITLEDLRVFIDKNGLTEKYQNGPNQYCERDSVQSKTYNIYIKNYTTIIKQLVDMLPKEAQDTDDSFKAFCSK